MCSIDKCGNCTNWYCSCSGRVYGIHLTKKWASYQVEQRPWWNRVIGWFIDIVRKPSVYPKSLSSQDLRTNRIKPHILRQLYSMLKEDNGTLEVDNEKV
jgi:hypothetical protein